jgi:hypothetical protein
MGVRGRRGCGVDGEEGRRRWGGGGTFAWSDLDSSSCIGSFGGFVNRGGA